MILVTGALRIARKLIIASAFSRGSRYVGLCCSTVIIVLLALHAYAEESLVQEPQSETSIEGEIKSRDEVAYDPTKRSILPGFYYKYRDKLWEWQRKHGLEVTFSYDIVGQESFDGTGSLGGIAGDGTLSGRWLLFGERYDLPVYLTFRLRSRNAYTEHAPADISSETGLFWKTVDGFNDAGFQVPSMYLSQELWKQEVILRYGQFSIDNFFDAHKLRSAKKFFLNQAFSSNPAVSFPSYGAGFVLQWNPNEKWELIGGVSNIQETEQNKEIDFGISSTALFESLQARYRFSGIGGKNFDIRLLGWHSDSINDEDIPEGRGVSLTIGHEGFEPGEDFVFRYAHAHGDATSADTILFAGYGKEIHSFDHVGMGVSLGRSSITEDWQVMLETYYRWRVYKELMITPDLQFILGDHIDNDTDVSVIAGLRFGFVF